ncbi:hypothetical protein DSCW_18040 [Desulfosarcina widdelii]|uniref:Uncharacterized protein n=1 Tax=Desulfosarcina widdelii TaxID=947919 RepID=A0A5K7ZDQ7_9BACT|nr:hypothetical protein [Desulfosarcina widdelii]BBO74387.1 hypothetical protein DSCW_18040 [Desulfosarcina widdelii]
MRKILSIFSLLILLVATQGQAANLWGVTSLTGGGVGALDALDITGYGSPNYENLSDGDVAVRASISGTTVTYQVFLFDADGTDAESSPDIIRPDDFSTQGVWRKWDPDDGPILKESELDDEGKLEDVTNTQIATEAEAQGYVAAGVTGTLSSLSDGEYMAVDYLTLTAGEDINLASFSGFPQVYFKNDGVNDGGRIFLFDADVTATDKETFPMIGVAVSTATTGNSITVRVEGMLARRDGFTTLTGNQDEGKPLYAGTTGGGLQTLVKPTTAGDDVCRVAIILQVDGSGGTGDVFLYMMPRVSVKVPI